MTNKLFSVAACAAMLAATQGVQAQNLMENATVNTLGAAKVWTSGTNEAYEFNVESLALVLNPENTENIFLFPEAQNGGGFDTEENRAIGIQGFYVDLGASKKIGTINTTWEGAAADAYSIYLTDEEPTLSILDTTPTYTAEGLGQYTSNVAILPDNATGRYVVFQPTAPTNYGWGCKIRSISAFAPQADELTFFSIEPAFIFDADSELTFSFRNQIGLPIDNDKVTVTCDKDTYADGKLTLAEGETAIFTATIDGNDELTFTVSHPKAPATPKNVMTGVYTKDYPNVLFQSGYNNPGGEEPTLNMGTHEFSNGELATLFHAAYCIFFYNDETMGQYGAWNTIDIEDPASTLGRYLNLQVYSSRPSHCAVSFNDNTPDQFPFTLPHDDWSNLSIDMTQVDNMRNMSLRFPDEHELDCLMIANIYFSGTQTGIDVTPVSNLNEPVDVYSASGILLKRNVKNADALEGLGKGLYIVGGKKVVK